VKLTDIQVLEKSHNLPAGDPYCAPDFAAIVEANTKILRRLASTQPWTDGLNEAITERLKQTRALVNMISPEPDNGRHRNIRAMRRLLVEAFTKPLGSSCYHGFR